MLRRTRSLPKTLTFSTTLNWLLTLHRTCRLHNSNTFASSCGYCAIQVRSTITKVSDTTWALLGEALKLFQRDYLGTFPSIASGGGGGLVFSILKHFYADTAQLTWLTNINSETGKLGRKSNQHMCYGWHYLRMNQQCDRVSRSATVPRW